jgi:hypothetical protein
VTTAAILIAAFALLLGAVVFIARKWGHAAALSASYEESHDKAVKARQIDDEVARLSDSALDDELRHPK